MTLPAYERRPTETLETKCERLLAELAGAKARERRASNDNEPVREPMWWERD